MELLVGLSVVGDDVGLLARGKWEAVRLGVEGVGNIGTDNQHFCFTTVRVCDGLW